MRKIVNTGKRIFDSKRDARNKSILDKDIAKKIDKIKNHEKIIKSNLWPTPDYAQMILDGTPVFVVGFLKMIRDKFSTSPKFIKGISNNYVEDVYMAYIDILNYMNIHSKDIKNISDITDCYKNILKIVGVEDNNFDYKSYSLKQQACIVSICSSNTLPFNISPNDLEKATLKGQKIIDSYNRKKNNQWILKEYYINNQKRYIYKQNDKNIFFGNENTYYNQFPKNKECFFKTKKEAEDSYLKNIKVKRNKIIKQPIIRIGTDYRNGNNITEENLRKTFGLYSVEFGVSLSNKERQASINHAYDSFSDLAMILKIPNNKIGLDKTLSIAFGSRGKVGNNAHYDVKNKVINLTRVRGAGSLAHEYGHALDNFLISKLVKSKNISFYFLSNSRRLLNSYDLLMIDNLINKMKYKEINMPIQQWNRIVKILYKKEYKININNNITDLELNDKEKINIEKLLIDIGPLPEKLYANLFKETDYYKISSKNNYYSSTKEMFARSFETYIFSELKKRGQSNQYLVSEHIDEENKKNYDFYPYPINEERIKINQEMEKVLNTFLERELLLNNNYSNQKSFDFM